MNTIKTAEYKSAEEILKEHLGNDLFEFMSEQRVFTQPSGNFPVLDLYYAAMEEYANQFKTQSVTNEEIERMIEKEIIRVNPSLKERGLLGYKMGTGMDKAFTEGIETMREAYREFWQYIKSSILPLLVTNEGASAATLEGLEEKIKEWTEEYLNNKHSLEKDFWPFLKPHLSALLKEKEATPEYVNHLVNPYRRQIQELQTQLKEKEEKIIEWKKKYEALDNHRQIIDSQLTNIREEAIGFKSKYEKCIDVIKRFDPGIIGMYDL